MKKLLLTCLLLVGMSSSYGQTYCTPAFSDGCADGDNIDTFSIPAASFTHQASPACSSGAYGDFFATQTITLQAGVPYNYTVTHNYSSSEQVRIWADFDNNGTYTDAAPELISEASEGDNSTTSGTINIPATVAPGTYHLRIAVRYNSQPIPCNTDGYGEAQDYKLVVTAPPSCLAPSAVTSSNILPFSATVSWTAPATAPANGYEYYYSNTNTAPTASTAASGTVTATTVNLANLTSSTAYYVWVRSVCSSSDKSAWSTSATFTTTSFCPSVTAPADGAIAVSITPTITWSAVTNATGYKLSVGTTSGGTDILNNVDLGNVLTYTFATPLSYATKYYYTVNAYNATNSSNSCDIRDFTTMCSIFVPSYTYNFGTFPDICWSFASGGSSATGSTGTTQYWFEDGFLNSGSTGSAKISLFTNNRTGWMISPTFNLSAGNYRLKFDYGLTQYFATTSSAMGSDDKIEVLMSVDGGTTWTSIQTWTAANAPSNTLNTFIYPISSTSNQVKFAFYGTDGTVDDTQDYEFFVDNFVVETIPLCDSPLAPSISAITTNSATFSWTAPSAAPANGYEYHYSTTNAAPSSGTATTANSVNLTSLNPQTTYYVFVRSICSTTAQSTWATTSFATPAVPPANDACSNAINGTPTVATPYTNSQDATGATNNGGFVSCGNSGMNDGVWYSITGDGTTMTVTLSNVTGGWDPAIGVYSGSCGSFTCVGNIDNFGNNTGETISFVALQGVTYFVNVGQYNSTADNPEGPFTITITTNGILGTNEIVNNGKEVKVYPNPFTDILNISDVKDLASVSVTDMAGRVVRVIAKPNAHLELSELKSGLYLVTLKYKDGTMKTVKAIKK